VQTQVAIDGVDTLNRPLLTLLPDTPESSRMACYAFYAPKPPILEDFELQFPL